MNGVAHYATSLLLSYLILKIGDQEKYKILRYLLIVVVNFYFHAVVDALADFTYHPSNSDWGDPVYAAWHIFIYAGEAVFAIALLRFDLRYVPGMLAAVGMDIWDWSIGRALGSRLGFSLPSVHRLPDWLSQNFLTWAPNWRNEQWAIIIEILVIIVLPIIWYKLQQKKPLLGERVPGSLLVISLLVLVIGFLRLLTLF